MPAMFSSAVTLITRHCPGCGDERPMEQPPCPDHAECPEWICIDCGTAVVVGWLEVDAPGAGDGPQRVSTAA